MSIIQPFLAQNVLPTDLVPAAWHWMGLTVKELLILLGALALVTVPLVIWAAYFRKRPRQGSHHHHHHHRHSRSEVDSPTTSENEEPGANGEKRYRRKRRRRREHRPRNPTLAETGGLPPVRSERPPDSLP